MTSQSAVIDATPNTKRAVALLDAGIAENKAQLAKRFPELARLLASEAEPTERDWQLAKASVALTMGILAREDEQVVRMLQDPDDDMEEWLLGTLRKQRADRATRQPSRRRVKRSGKADASRSPGGC